MHCRKKVKNQSARKIPEKILKIFYIGRLQKPKGLTEGATPGPDTPRARTGGCPLAAWASGVPLAYIYVVPRKLQRMNPLLRIPYCSSVIVIPRSGSPEG